MKKYYIIIFVIFIIGFILISFPKKNYEETFKKIPNLFNYRTTDLDIAIKKNIRENPIDSIVSDKTIYLTFDDGPSYLTSSILDILKEEEVVATFFVIGTHIYDYKDVVKRAYDEGHTIAIHSDTHDYKYVYASLDNYFADMQAIRSKIYEITGNNSRIIRLPGGSSNTVSRKYCEGVVTNITNKLIDDDFYYFDWNVDSGDASGKLSRETIYNNVVNHLNYRSNIVLMHDASSKITTVQALGDIIKYGKENGYTFARITKNTQAVRHSINN